MIVRARTSNVRGVRFFAGIEVLRKWKSKIVAFQGGQFFLEVGQMHST